MNDSPDRRRVPLRVLVRFLALFLVPVVVVAGPNVAQAATVYGDGVNFSVELSDPTSDSMSCVGVGQWVVPDTSGLLTPYVKFANIKCPLTFALGNQTSCDSDDCSEVVVEVEGEGCSASGVASIIAGSSDWATFAGPSLTLDPLCDVSSLCLTFNGYANNMPDMGTGRGCVGWPLGVVPEGGSPMVTGCNAGNVTAPPTVTVGEDPEFGAPWKRLTVTIPFDSNASEQFMANWLPTNGGSPTDQAQWAAFTNTPGTTPATNELVFFFRQYNADTNWMQPRGVQLWQYSNRVIPTNVAAMEEGGANFNMGSHVGLTQASACVWYFGPKIRVTATNDLDEPAASLDGSSADSGTPITDDAAAAPPGSDKVDESCAEGFSIWKPGTWVSAGYCEIVSGLSTVARTLMGIPRAILGGLGGLFVPVDAPSWSDVPSPLPGGWVPSFDSLAAGGCAPLTMPQLDLGYAGSVGPTQMFDTCDEPWPLVRTFTYNGLLAMVLVGAIWQAYRAVATALGMNVQGGGGGGDDE